MKLIHRLATKLLAGLLLAMGLPLVAHADNVYYTQVNMWANQRNEILATNYHVDVLLPVNTKVTVGRKARNRIQFTVEGRGQFVLANVPQHTTVDLDTLFARTFGREPVDLSQFSADAQEAIARGEMRVGMTKAEIIVARGYPPGHETRSLDDDQWRFWRHRFATNLVHFENGKVVQIQ